MREREAFSKKQFHLLSSSGRMAVRVCFSLPENEQIGWPFGGSFHFCPGCTWRSSCRTDENRRDTQREREGENKRKIEWIELIIITSSSRTIRINDTVVVFLFVQMQMRVTIMRNNNGSRKKNWEENWIEAIETFQLRLQKGYDISHRCKKGKMNSMTIHMGLCDTIYTILYRKFDIYQLVKSC